jgi:hypothetical protein
MKIASDQRHMHLCAAINYATGRKDSDPTLIVDDVDFAIAYLYYLEHTEHPVSIRNYFDTVITSWNQPA